MDIVHPSTQPNNSNPNTEAKVLEDTKFTFAVDNVKITNTAPGPLKSAHDIVTKTLGIDGKSEDFSHRGNKDAVFVEGKVPGFILALHTAYESHSPLKLSVSDFIILIGQGLGRHINQNAEKLREHFVSHEGKEDIIIFRDEFVMGHQNDWSTVFGEFGLEIKKRVKSDIYDVVVDDTSVATNVSRIVSELTLMDCMQSYFKYVVVTRCGIPQITLEGSKEDWENLRGKVHKLVEMNKDNCLLLNFWLQHLVPVVEEICDTGATRKVNPTFWSGIYKYANPGSGSPYISGWCTAFFPYLASDKVNSFREPAAITTNEIPKQLSEVPFIWLYHNKPIPMHFYGGFLGAKYDKVTNTVEPAHFWNVVYDDGKKKSPEKAKGK